MKTYTISSREFARDIAAAKRASARGPVLITIRGAPAYVLLSIDDYRRLAGPRLTLMEAMDSLEHTGGEDLHLPKRGLQRRGLP